MSTDVQTMPEWAMEAAAGLRSAVIWQSNAANEAIALALVTAERRGMDRAANLLEAGYDRVPGESWREDGSPSKLDKCAHGLYDYEDCERCAVIAIRNLPVNP